MLSINTNLSSLIVQSNLLNSTLGLNQAIERMTTGFKINGAKDNAAGYSISTNMTTKIGAYQVAEDNAMIGLDILNTASSSLELISNGLSRLRALAVQAANGTYGNKSLDVINSEANSIVDEIDKIYKSAEFNGVQLLKQDRLPSANFINEVTQVDTSQMTKLADVDENTTITSGSTYSISTAEELKKLADMTNSGKVKGGSFYLADNIDLSAYKTGEGWTPIGTSANPFQGVFNGNGYVVSNLYINTTAATSYVGLFGRSSEIRHLGVEDAYINAPNASYVGILVGAATNNALGLINCYSTGKVTGKNSVGGLCGQYQTSDCYSTADVTGNNYVGGLGGVATARHCFSSGRVIGNSHVGGLVGGTDFIQNSYTTSKVTGNSYVGGLVGTINGSGVMNCYVLSRSEGLDGVFIGHFESVSGGVSNSYYNSYYEGQPLIGDTGHTTTNVQSYDGDVPFAPRPEYHPVEFDLQVGIDSSDSSKITVDTSFDIWKLDSLRNIGYMKSSVLLQTIDDIISRVSERQTSLGAYQNRLESALEQISVQYDNLVSSRSTIRDADIAEESSQYIKMQILQQASATLLATANQTPGIALQLL